MCALRRFFFSAIDGGTSQPEAKIVFINVAHGRPSLDKYDDQDEWLRRLKTML